MDAGCAGIIGAVVGAGATILGNAISYWMQTKRASPMANCPLPLSATPPNRLKV
jgi:hypothetical protein